MASFTGKWNKMWVINREVHLVTYIISKLIISPFAAFYIPRTWVETATNTVSVNSGIAASHQYITKKTHLM